MATFDELPQVVQVASQPAQPAAPPAAPEMILELMHTMRAMRRLKPDPVPREILEQLVAAATWAPSAANIQAYSYLVVTDRDQMARLAVLWRNVADFYLTLGMKLGAKYPSPNLTAEQFQRMLAALRYQEEHFAQTPALIVACYNTSASRMSDFPDLWSSLRGLSWRHRRMVIGHLSRCKLLGEAASSYPGVQNLLLAARALGLGATLTTWHLFLEDDFKQVLGLPSHITPFAFIPVGYPMGRFGPVRRIPATEIIHWDRW